MEIRPHVTVMDNHEKVPYQGSLFLHNIGEESDNMRLLNTIVTVFLGIQLLQFTWRWNKGWFFFPKKWTLLRIITL